MASNKSSVNSKKAAYRRKTQTKKKNEVKKTKKTQILDKRTRVKTKDDVIMVEEEKRRKKEQEKMQEIAKKNGFSIAGLVCSTCGIISCGITSLVGIVLSLFGVKKSKKLNGIGKNMAITGVIIGIITLTISVISFSSIAILSNDAYGKAIRNAKNKKIPIYKLNKKVTVTDAYGDYKIEILGIRETNERNERSKIKANRVLIISYEYENISQDENLFITGARFNAYDVDSKKLVNYPISYLSASSITKGRKANAEVVYALNSDKNHVELEFYKNIFDSKPYCIFDINW